MNSLLSLSLMFMFPSNRYCYHTSITLYWSGVVFMQPHILPFTCLMCDLDISQTCLIEHQSLQNICRRLHHHITIIITIINITFVINAVVIIPCFIYEMSDQMSFTGFLNTMRPNDRFNTLRPRQNGRRFADDTFKRIFLNENVRISIKISLKFVPKGLINNNPALVQIMAWRRSGDKSLSEPMVVSLLTHKCVIRSEWVKYVFWVLTRKSFQFYPTLNTHLSMYWKWILCGISKATFEIPHKYLPKH